MVVDFLDKLKWDNDGLLPAIVQDDLTEEVLMLAYMNKESLERSLELGEAVYFSRSRQDLWHKGETSGHFQRIKKIFYDCDRDTILLRVEQIGVACHEGDKSCFHYDLTSLLDSGSDLRVKAKDNSGILFGKRIAGLEAVIADRFEKRPEGAYTTYLFEKGIDKILKKVGEETAEVIIGAKNEGKSEVVYEASDLFYHLLVLFKEKGVSINDIEAELANRYK
ncbi:MAG: bifunctional phosphoribosyl-AMP cyclohydrolase/phosphoribosyl-ATP diphosphatase HisIE [Fusobacteria bacterium]|nr:bifunctional phosphoribosyl-AMP cyclohydrolase/phosphoribosyl-ATP diphosphatase HisIE [Fusobacteriota bacterium]